MPATHASIVITTPARYMARLCNHFSHRVDVHREPDSARIEFPDARCKMTATEKQLEIHIEAEQPLTLERLEQVVTRHLKQVAAAETFDVAWERDDT